VLGSERLTGALGRNPTGVDHRLPRTVQRSLNIWQSEQARARVRRFEHL
jgi:hypothetical protein